MTLHHLDSPEAVQSFISSNNNAVICFSATWCVPCSKSKPALEEMARSYQADVTTDVKFGISYEHNLGNAIHRYGVRAFPTYVLFRQQREVGRIEGVNLEGVRNMITAAGCSADLTGGQSLGGGDATTKKLSPGEARLQRLARLSSSPAAAAAAEAPKEVEPDMQIKTKQQEEDVEMKDATAEEEKVAPEDPTAKLDKESLQTLTESMGFSLLRAQKGLLFGSGGTIEGAVDWITEHQDDDDIDDPISPPGEGGGVAQSYKCNECGKILSNMANLELHANKTGHSDFEESTQQVKSLTTEEKAKKIEEIKALLKAKRAERETAEQEDEKEREKQRRFMGKEMAKTREQLEAEQRKREAMFRRKQKEEEKRERERIRAELAKDKMERKANKGKLSSKLGVEGYQPDGIQYDVVGGGGGGEKEQAAPHAPQKIHVSSAKIDEYIQKVSGYRAGGDGGKSLKILLAIVGNVVDNPDEDKFKHIKTDGKAYKHKVKPFLGAKHLLIAVGFKENESGDALVLSDEADQTLLADTKAKLAAALEAYGK